MREHFRFRNLIFDWIGMRWKARRGLNAWWAMMWYFIAAMTWPCSFSLMSQSIVERIECPLVLFDHLSLHVSLQLLSPFICPSSTVKIWRFALLLEGIAYNYVIWKIAADYLQADMGCSCFSAKGHAKPHHAADGENFTCFFFLTKALIWWKLLQIVIYVPCDDRMLLLSFLLHNLRLLSF